MFLQVYLCMMGISRKWICRLECEILLIPQQKLLEYSAKNAKFIGVANIDNDFVLKSFTLTEYSWNSCYRMERGGQYYNSIVSLDKNEKQISTQLN